MGTNLVLSNGLVILNAASIVRTKFERFPWAWYDGVSTSPDEITPVDFAITIAMNSRATAARMKAFLSRCAAMEALLRSVPSGVQLSSSLADDVLAAVRALFAEACAAHGTALAVASKVLHRKRPHLIPMLDSVVVDQHYWPALQALAALPEKEQPAWFDPTWLKRGAWSDPTTYMHVMAIELDANREPLEAIRRAVPREILPAEASDVRVLEAALYGYLQRMEA